MDIKVLLPKEHVVLPLRGGTRRDVLGALSAPLFEEGLISDAEVFLDAVEHREDEVTTQLAGGVAFPHARSPFVRRLALTVGIAPPPGLAFNPSLDTPCQLFFLLAIPALAPTSHLPVLQRLANFVHDEKRLSKLLSSETQAQVAKALHAFKG
ncbi:MAG: PTS sugar transporter subunit IIA [Lentisphaerae bacterium]|jgi:fructose PTS system EIIBC or EIIC component|nr:PTS sugar transporter subunit IIA [Lentisphaerota bacterium]MBT4822220.1 PTS sugar transporter subunit IIA [Lentisphaerota bacterium]MBT5604466.1 PTS sugar transporter subunit IIA [Lentisphaerota bacterium]MBT7060467.1 PTS sugar transporter subunit IIA [Lentisphaerota bacterium]MBT7844374.1 PTS sugar transporter subunit IIA [Lentisphaerota bacterium]